MRSPRDRSFDAVTNGSEESISALFERLDANGDGSLYHQEISDVIAAYHGKPFDSEAFFKFYNANDGSSAEGTVDQKE